MSYSLTHSPLFLTRSSATAWLGIRVQAEALVMVHVWCSATEVRVHECRRTTLLPYENETPETLWSKVAAPDSRFWSATGVYNVPVNITWMSGTMYVVSSDLEREVRA